MKATSKSQQIQAEMLMAKTRALNYLTPKELLDYARGEMEDKKIQIGYRIGFGLALVELMYYWQETDENLKDYIARHNEFLEVYGSTDKEDKQKMFELFDELKRRTGYTITGD